MAEDSEIRWQAPLKVPAVEVIDLLSDDSGELGPGTLLDESAEKRDASGAESDGEDDGQWEEDSQWSLYEDALLGEDGVEPVYGSKLAPTNVPWSED